MLALRHRIRRLSGRASAFRPQVGMEVIYRDLFRRELAGLEEVDSFFPTGGAANYSLLYLIARIAVQFRPASVLDVGAGQSSLLWSRLRRRGLVGEVVTLESDAEWGARISMQVDHPIIVTPLCTTRIADRQVNTYDWGQIRRRGGFEVIVCDGPNGTPQRSRRGVLAMLDQDLPRDFALIFDDAERDGEQDTIAEVHDRLRVLGIDYEMGVVRAAKSQAVFATGRYRPAVFL